MTTWEPGGKYRFLGACSAVGAVFLSRLLPYFNWRDPRDPAFEWMLFLSWGGYLCPPVLFAKLQLVLSHCFSILLPSWWIHTLRVQAGLGWSVWRVCHTVKGQDILSVPPGRAGTGSGFVLRLWDPLTSCLLWMKCRSSQKMRALPSVHLHSAAKKWIYFHFILILQS